MIDINGVKDEFGDFATYNTDAPNEPDWEKVKKLFEIVTELDKKDPIKILLSNAGFHPENGDLLILPETWEIKEIDHPNLAFSKYVDDPIILRKPDPFVRSSVDVAKRCNPLLLNKQCGYKLGE